MIKVYPNLLIFSQCLKIVSTKNKWISTILKLSCCKLKQIKTRKRSNRCRRVALPSRVFRPRWLVPSRSIDLESKRGYMQSRLLRQVVERPWSWMIPMMKRSWSNVTTRGRFLSRTKRGLSLSRCSLVMISFFHRY